jgi:hypothetical protein
MEEKKEEERRRREETILEVQSIHLEVINKSLEAYSRKGREKLSFYQLMHLEILFSCNRNYLEFHML